MIGVILPGSKAHESTSIVSKIRLRSVAMRTGPIEQPFTLCAARQCDDDDVGYFSGKATSLALTIAVTKNTNVSFNLHKSASKLWRRAWKICGVFAGTWRRIASLSRASFSSGLVKEFGWVDAQRHCDAYDRVERRVCFSSLDLVDQGPTGFGFVGQIRLGHFRGKPQFLDLPAQIFLIILRALFRIEGLSFRSGSSGNPWPVFSEDGVMEPKHFAKNNSGYRVQLRGANCAKKVSRK